MNIISAMTIEEKALAFDRLLALKENEEVQAVVLAVANEVATEARKKKRTVLDETDNKEVDIFDFTPYRREQKSGLIKDRPLLSEEGVLANSLLLYEAFAVHYSDLELMLRFAIFLDYRYNHLSPENRDLVNIQKSKKTGKTLFVSGYFDLRSKKVHALCPREGEYKASN